MNTRGRPRQFDREEALRTAMQLFWRYGYEGTSVAAVRKAIGITSPSLYAAFGSKEDLYRESIDLYIRTFSAPSMRVLEETSEASEAVQAFLVLLAKQFTTEGQYGCMIAGGDVVCAPENAKFATEMAARRALAEDAIRARLTRAVKEGQIAPTADTKGLGSYFATFIQGMSVQARDGASFNKLCEIISLAMKAWPTEAPQADDKKGGGKGRSQGAHRTPKK